MPEEIVAKAMRTVRAACLHMGPAAGRLQTLISERAGTAPRTQVDGALERFGEARAIAESMCTGAMLAAETGLEVWHRELPLIVLSGQVFFFCFVLFCFWLWLCL
jgi:hypothetical protein